jgi:hypothetical protein
LNNDQPAVDAHGALKQQENISEFKSPPSRRKKSTWNKITAKNTAQ